MLTDQDGRAIVLGVIQLAKTFKRSVIAEGIETIEHGEKFIIFGLSFSARIWDRQTHAFR